MGFNNVGPKNKNKWKHASSAPHFLSSLRSSSPFSETFLLDLPQKQLKMAAVCIIGSVAASFGIAYVCDRAISDGKVFGGTTPGTVSNQGWWEETDKKFQAWPRTAGPPVVMNPISRQNFILKSR